MSSTLIIAGSPSGTSRTLKLAHSLRGRFEKLSLQNELLDLRTLPAQDLLHANFESTAIKAAIAQLEAASGVVVVTPIYKAAYSGLLKTFIDLLPQFGLRNKVVLPLAMGGGPAHVLAIDYALRPMLSSLDPLHIVAGFYLQEKQVTAHPDGQLEVEPEMSARLDEVLSAYASALHRSIQPAPGPQAPQSPQAASR
jgi:FMN reductase